MILIDLIIMIDHIKAITLFCINVIVSVQSGLVHLCILPTILCPTLVMLAKDFLISPKISIIKFKRKYFFLC